MTDSGSRLFDFEQFALRLRTIRHCLCTGPRDSLICPRCSISDTSPQLRTV
jgi:hypothetical protein